MRTHTCTCSHTADCTTVFNRKPFLSHTRTDLSRDWPYKHRPQRRPCLRARDEVQTGGRHKKTKHPKCLNLGCSQKHQGYKNKQANKQTKSLSVTSESVSGEAKNTEQEGNLPRFASVSTVSLSG